MLSVTIVAGVILLGHIPGDPEQDEGLQLLMIFIVLPILAAALGVIGVLVAFYRRNRW
jgi:hypothetical protein